MDKNFNHIAKEQKYPGTSLLAVNIEGVCWAPVNLGYNEYHKYGLLYQWGRKYGQGFNMNDSLELSIIEGPVSISEGNDIANNDKFYIFKDSPFDWCIPQALSWNMSLYNPCPKGWRLPTNEEFLLLYNSGCTWVKSGGPNAIAGRWFGGNHNGDHAGSIFLPAAGHRHSYAGAIIDFDEYGYYWTDPCRHNKVGCFFNFACYFVKREDNCFRANGLSIRCVKD